MKTHRLQKRIRDFVSDGPKSWNEILNYLNENYTHGTTRHQLCNVLPRMKGVTKVGYIKAEDIKKSSYKVSVWGPTK